VSFVSRDFALLLLVVLALLVMVRPVRWRKAIVLGASCVFYGYWDWRFLAMIIFVTVLDYAIALRMADSPDPRRRKALLVLSLVVNLGLLAVFKYFNFFIGSLGLLLAPLGWQLATLQIILPVGISFYTFETLSYVIDVYRGTAKPTRSLLDYAVFVTFFPRLVAGPIMRASHFLPQLERGVPLKFENIVDGSQIFIRGMFKKIVIADNVSMLVDRVYAAPALFAPATVWLSVLAYSIQILCDFSGYSDMAIGLGRMLGFDLPMNFNLPYTAQSIGEFWRRWHISLSTWLRDYLYIPLGGSRRGTARTYANLMITMLLGGLWHGASWDFVFWGGLHGLYLAVERLLGVGRSGREGEGWKFPLSWLKAVAVFMLVSVTWIFFRSPSLPVTVVMFQKLLFVDRTGFQWFSPAAIMAVLAVVVGGMAARAYAREWWPRLSFSKSYAPALLLAELLCIFFLAPTQTSPFIYFQF